MSRNLLRAAAASAVVLIFLPGARRPEVESMLPLILEPSGVWLYAAACAFGVSPAGRPHAAFALSLVGCAGIASLAFWWPGWMRAAGFTLFALCALGSLALEWPAFLLRARRGPWVRTRRAVAFSALAAYHMLIALLVAAFSVETAWGLVEALFWLLACAWTLGWLTLNEWRGGSNEAMGYSALSGVWAFVGLLVACLGGFHPGALVASAVALLAAGAVLAQYGAARATRH